MGKTDWDFVWPLTLAVGFLLFFVLCTMAGCATVKTAPCLSAPVPQRVKFHILTEMEQFNYTDAEGNPAVAAKLIVNPESMIKFFDYMESLEAIAKRAAGCVVTK